MAYYLESKYLDLKKSYQNFQYESLLEKGKVIQDEIVLPDINTEEQQDQQKNAEGNPYEGISQNTYLFVQEKEILQQDISNICRYFQEIYVQRSSEISDGQLKIFPFIKIKDRICHIIQKYQEQPVLLDPLMEEMILPLMKQIRSYLKKIMLETLKKQSKFEEITQDFHDLVSVVYILCKVRHHKYINKFFPHEVEDLEPVIFYLISQRDQQQVIWETKYVLLLWMSIIVLVPFDLTTIDSKNIQMEYVKIEDFDWVQSSQDQQKQSPEKGTQPPASKREFVNNDIVQNLIEVGKFYLKSSTKTRDASAVFLSNFFSRPDVQKMGTLLPIYIDWATTTIQQIQLVPMYQQFMSGIYQSLVEIFKIGQRKDLLALIPKLMILINAQSKGEHTIVRHLKAKLAQRLGMTYLRPRAVSWAYKRGNKSLVENIQKTITDSKIKTNVQQISSKGQQSSKQQADSQDQQHLDSSRYFEDVEESHLEDIIDFLLLSLRDKDTVVRWSAAKGIGRITGRLDMDMADDVVSAVLQLFSPNETEATWHGGCLTIGELSRRGLLLPNRLEEVFPIIHKALHFDLNQGNYSVGANVRDSACYIAWAFARAYDPEVLAPHVSELSKNLLITCIYDREVNCRRAASAAFQEHVGRQGSFAHGIQILTEADYFTLGLRNNAYLNVGPYVGSYEVYFKGFIEHLAFVKLRHWDQDIRKLSAAALALMTCLNPKFMVDDILRGLVNLCFNENVNVRHGALYGISEILCGLTGKGHLHCNKDEMKDSVFLITVQKNERKLIKAGEYMTLYKENYEKLKLIDHSNLIDDALLKDILSIVGNLEKQRLFRGKGGEVMRIATSRLIEAISIARLPLKQVHIKQYMATLEENLKSFIDLIQLAGQKSFQQFSAVYHNEIKPEYTSFVENMIKKAPTDPNIAITRGYTKGLSVLNKVFLKLKLNDIIECMRLNTAIKPKDLDDAYTRKYAVQGLGLIIQTVGLDDESLTQELFEKIYQILFEATNDYTMDKRGDIGAIVREQSMITQSQILKQYVKQQSVSKVKITESIMTQIIQILLQQLSEKIDRVRLIAGSVLQEIFDNFYANVPNFPHKAHLQTLFNKSTIREIVKRDQDKIDNIFETEVVKADLTYFLLDDASRETDEYTYYWNVPSAAYPIVVPLLEFPEYSYYLIKGLCVSVGGISESVIKFSSQQITEYLNRISKHERRDELFSQLFSDIIKVLNDNSKDERVVVPMFKTLDYILEKDCVQKWPGIQQFSYVFFNIVTKQIVKTKSIMKLSASVGLVVGLLNFDNDLRLQVLSLIVTLLIHEFPKIRKQIADKFYVLLLTNGEELFGDNNDKYIDYVLQYEWVNDHLNVNNIKKELKDLFGVEPLQSSSDVTKQKQTLQKQDVNVQKQDDEI